MGAIASATSVTKNKNNNNVINDNDNDDVNLNNNNDNDKDDINESILMYDGNDDAMEMTRNSSSDFWLDYTAAAISVKSVLFAPLPPNNNNNNKDDTIIADKNTIVADKK